ncbi:CCC motif membrane protein [Gillisia marina]|uniref:CCC motif membrane protein n=1 Tax=Gillisia marina TaxID=1167637 RepID=UPI00029ABD49|nr:CCC motif membrane protein [Gillisia marina]
MELNKQELPNATLILILGILSILGCCCYGVVGVIFGIITLVLAKKAMEIYNANPEMYLGYQNVKIGRILAIIGLVLSALFLLACIAMLIFFGGMEGLEEFQREMIEKQGM